MSKFKNAEPEIPGTETGSQNRRTAPLDMHHKVNELVDFAKQNDTGTVVVWVDKQTGDIKISSTGLPSWVTENIPESVISAMRDNEATRAPHLNTLSMALEAEAIILKYFDLKHYGEDFAPGFEKMTCSEIQSEILALTGNKAINILQICGILKNNGCMKVTRSGGVRCFLVRKKY